MFSLDRLLLPFLNHLLRNETWARLRLRPHAGAQVLIQAGFIDLLLRVEADGFFALGDSASSAAVTVSLPADTPARFVFDRKSIFQSARLSGSADYAEALAFVFRNLHWDIEADLAKVVGDIPARRLEQFRRSFGHQVADTVQRSCQNLAEYATEDSDYLVSQREIQDFASQVNRLRDDCARLEKRLARL